MRSNSSRHDAHLWVSSFSTVVNRDSFVQLIWSIRLCCFPQLSLSGVFTINMKKTHWRWFTHWSSLWQNEHSFEYLHFSTHSDQYQVLNNTIALQTIMWIFLFFHTSSVTQDTSLTVAQTQIELNLSNTNWMHRSWYLRLVSVSVHP